MRLLALTAAGLLLSSYTSQRWKEPFEILPAPTEAGTLATKLGSGTSAVWQEGDVLTFLYKADTESVDLSGGIQKPMQRIPATDLWVLRLKMSGWDKAMVSYVFITPSFKEGTKLYPQFWRGANAPSKPEKVAKVEDLKGRIIEKKIMSKALGEERDLTVYLPPNAPKSGLPAFFMADGGGCAQFAMNLEPLILAGKVKPVAIIGVHDGGYRGDRANYKPENDCRAQEYIPGYSRFDKHLEFFTGEVVDFVTKEYGISKRREDRAVFGYSNGGAFTLGAAVNRPEVFGAAIPMSAGMLPPNDKPASPLPKMFFLAGSLESFSGPTNQYYEKVKGWGADASMTLYVAGHDWEMWQLGFVEMAPKIFPAGR